MGLNTFLLCKVVCVDQGLNLQSKTHVFGVTKEVDVWLAEPQSRWAKTICLELQLIKSILKMSPVK